MATQLERLQKAEADKPVPYTEYDLLNSPEFKVLVDIKIELDLAKKHAEDRLKEVNVEIEAMLAASEAHKVAVWDGYVVNRRNGTTASAISPTKLLENGVGMDVIAASTVEGKSYTFIVIDNPEAAAAKREEKKAAGKGRGR